MNLVNELRCLAEDLYSANSASPIVSALSRAADRIAELEDQKPFYGQKPTYAPSISDAHLRALAAKCGLMPGYKTAELVAAIIGYARVVLNDPAVQEAFYARSVQGGS
jgi:hypothetical protein